MLFEQLWACERLSEIIRAQAGSLGLLPNALHLLRRVFFFAADVPTELIKPRSELPKFPMLGKTVDRLEGGTPNQVARVAAY